MTEADAAPGRDEAQGQLGLLLLQGHDLIEQSSRVHREQWGLGSAERYDLDGHLSFGRVTITHADGTERYVNLSVD
jgi:hypothetical protein